MNPILIAGFMDELEKTAWMGTYYHGAPLSSEVKILKEGLIPGKGKDKGAVATYLKHQGWMLDPRVKERLKKNTKDMVTMSRSKNLARIYGMFLDPNRRDRIRAIATRGKSVSKMLLEMLVSFYDYHPLQISGKGLSATRLDPDHRLLSIQSPKKVDPTHISRGASGWTGRQFQTLARRLLRR